DATAGYIAGDPYAPPPPARPFLSEVSSKPRQLRIAFTTKAPYGVVLDPEIVNAIQDTAKLCAELGHQVEEAGFDLDATRLGPSFLTVYSTGLATIIESAARACGREPQEKDFEAMTWNFYQRARQFTGSQYL